MKGFFLSFKTLKGACILLLIITVLSSPVNGEHLFLKNGSIIEGRILSDTAEGVSIKLPDGNVKYYKNSKILRTIYWKFNGEKSYIKLTSGGMLSGYKVDEDLNTVTLRNKLYVNKEFTIEKSTIQYISSAIPSNLSGQIDGDNIVLSWESSLSNIKHFEILIRKEGEKEFNVAGLSDYPGYIIRKPDRNIVYEIKTRSVDVRGDVSPESNVIQVRMDGVVLPVPEITGYEADYIEDEDDYSINMNWILSADNQELIQKYRIFLKSGDSFRVVGESESKNILIKYSESGLNPDVNNTFIIRSVSSTGVMSGDSEEFVPVDFVNVKLPRVRLGTGIASLGDSTLQKRYGTGYGFTGDVFLFRYRFKDRYYESSGFDAGIRGMYRVFSQDDKIFTSVDEPTIWANTMKLYSCDLFIRYSQGFLFLNEHWDWYVSAAPRFLYSQIKTSGKPEYAGGDDTYTYKSFGAVGGLGFELTLFKWFGLFSEYNYGFVPLDSEGQNVEGHQLYAGVIMRQSSL